MKKLLTVVLCALMVFGSVVSVAPTTALAKSKCSHKKTKWVTLVKADCTQEGKRAKMCTNCGKTLKTVKVKRTSHHLKKMVYKKATCTNPDAIGWYCTNPDCIYGYRKYYKTEQIRPLNHKWKSKTYAATCTTPKVEISICSRCHAQDSFVQGRALGHKWSKWKLSATSMVKKKPKKTRVCSRCHKKETVYIK